MYYINQIVNRKVHLKLVELVKEIKQNIEAGQEFLIQGSVLALKDDRYYKFLKKILKFLGKITLEDNLESGILEEVIFDLWLTFFESPNNESKESAQINSFVKSFMDKYLNLLKVDVVADFLKQNIPKMETCVWKEFFQLFKRMVLFVNEKHGNVAKDEVLLDGGYFNDYDSKKLEFYVLRVPSQELNFFNELESLFLSTRNTNLESFLCSLLCSLLTKPTYASSETDALYRQEENKLIQRSLKYLSDDGDLDDFEYKNVPQKLIYKIKFLQLLNMCIGHGEPFGSGALKSFASIREGVPLLLNFEKENSYSTKTTTKFFFSNW